jgi:cysteinyl-tRNA synthetase
MLKMLKMIKPIIKQEILSIAKRSNDPKYVRRILLQIHSKRHVPSAINIAHFLRKAKTLQVIKPKKNNRVTNIRRIIKVIKVIIR